MAEQISVPLKGDDRVDKIIPDVERVTQPEMTVVSLLRYPVDGFRSRQYYWLTVLTGIQTLLEKLLLVGAAITVRKIVERYSCSIRVKELGADSSRKRTSS